MNRENDCNNFNNRKKDHVENKSSKWKAAKESHCEIEKRRRNKMNAYICELGEMLSNSNFVPQSSQPCKMDKLSVLKAAVKYLQELNKYESNDKSSFLSDLELKQLMLEAANCFLIVVNCATLKILYVSDTVGPVLAFPKEELINLSLCNLVHEDDHKKLLLELSMDVDVPCHVLNLNDNTITEDINLKNHRFDDDATRDFIIRFKTGNYNNQYPVNGISQEVVNQIQNECHSMNVVDSLNFPYLLVNVTGLIKKTSFDSSNLLESLVTNLNGGNQTCFVAVCYVCSSLNLNKSLLSNNSHIYSLRLSLEHEITYIDESLSNYLGYEDNFLMKKSLFQLVESSDIPLLYEALQDAQNIDSNEKHTVALRLRLKHANYDLLPLKDLSKLSILFKASLYLFVNPYSNVCQFYVFQLTPVQNINNVDHTEDNQSLSQHNSTVDSSKNAQFLDNWLSNRK